MASLNTLHTPDAQGQGFELEASHYHTLVGQVRESESGVSRIPQDILCLIFEADPIQARQRVVVPSRNPGKTILVPFPVVVSHVSRAWRNAAIHNPFLWTTIKYKESKSREYYHLYVERSKSCSLDLEITCDADTLADNKFDPSNLHLYRCRKLLISFYSFRRALNVFRCLRTEFAPCLKALIISLSESSDSERNYNFAEVGDIFSGGAPILSSVNLHGISLMGCRPPLSAIKMLKLCSRTTTTTLLSSYQFSGILHSSLTRLSLAGVLVHFDDIHDINLPALAFLEIRAPDLILINQDQDWDFDYYITNLWKCLNTPALTTLSLYNLGDNELRSCMNGLMLERHTSVKISLNSLRLERIRIYRDTGNLILAACPNIVKFSLIDTVAKPVMGLILDNARNINTLIIWPHLRRLGVVTPQNLEIVRDVVLARKTVGYPIVKFLLDGRLSTEARVWFNEQRFTPAHRKRIGKDREKAGTRKE